MAETLIPILQVIRALAWGWVFLINTPAFGRLLTGHMRDADFARVAVWLTAASEIGFSTRWLLYPVEMDHMPGLGFWAGVYVLSIMAALMCAWLIGAAEKARGE